MKQWYYAKNGQQQGPSSRAEVEALYQKGELTPSDLVWEEGMPEWVSAGSVFTVNTTGQSLPTPVPYSTAGADLDIMNCIRQGWSLVWAKPEFLIGGCFLSLILASVAGIPNGIGTVLQVMAQGHAGNSHELSPLLIAAFAFRGLGMIVNMIVSPLIYSGTFWFILQIIRGGPGNFADLLAGFRSSWLNLVLTGIVGGVLTVIGMLCCIIPGIYLGVSYVFALPLVIDKKMGFWEALELSRKRVTEKWFLVFGLLILTVLITIAGMLCFCIGIFIAIPVTYAALMYAYQNLFCSVESQTL